MEYQNSRDHLFFVSGIMQINGFDHIDMIGRFGDSLCVTGFEKTLKKT